VSDSDLVAIAKRNGEFRRNYGPWLGAYLYLKSTPVWQRAKPRVLNDRFPIKAREGLCRD
jgi:hypothetical protein